MMIWFIINHDVAFSLSPDAYLNKCLSSTTHKMKPGPEGTALKPYHCTPWQNHSCCTWNISSQIHQDGSLSLYGMIWDQCPGYRNMSEKCKQHFMRDTCFYQCSPNLGPWIVTDSESKKTRKERIINVPLCASDCDKWFNDCKNDYTCNDNWGKNWDWSKKGTPQMCPTPYQCKTFGEYFKDSKEFCEKIFDNSFKYQTNKKNCMNLTPIKKKNEKVAEHYANELSKQNSSSVGNNPKLFMLMLSMMIFMFIM